MSNPFNPLDWIQAAQDWFTRTERSSGFRPYLIFLITLFSFVIIASLFLKDNPRLIDAAINLLWISVLSFLVLFTIKSFQDPDFCRSEKHIENVRKIELMQQKGDVFPVIINAKDAALVTNSDGNLIASSEGKE